MPNRKDLPLTALAAAILGALGAPHARAAEIVVDQSMCTLADAILAANTDAQQGGCSAGSGRDTLLISGFSELGGTAFPPIVTDMDLRGAFGSPPNIGAEGGRVFFVGGDSGGMPIAPTVTFTNLLLTSGNATGGSGSGPMPTGTGAGGGAGLGGMMFVYAGNVTLRNVTITNSVARGGNGSAAGNDATGGGGGGGMSGVGGGAIEGLPGSAGLPGTFGGGGGGGGDKSINENGGTNGGRGGGTTGGAPGFVNMSPAEPGGFGGGGGGAASAVFASDNGLPGANGGFGGGGGGGSSAIGMAKAGNGGFGGFGGGGGAGGGAATFGGDGGNGGFGAGGGGGGFAETANGAPGFGSVGARGGTTGIGGAGGGFGGAIFIRSGTVHLNRSGFASNTATGGTGAAMQPNGDGLGGAIAVLASLNAPNGNSSGYPNAPATVTGCETVFMSNTASTPLGDDTNNNDTFGVSRMALLSQCPDLFTDGFE